LRLQKMKQAIPMEIIVVKRSAVLVAGSDFIKHTLFLK
jgi:hypothetical protein